MLIFCYDDYYFAGNPDDPETWDFVSYDIDDATHFNDFSNYYELLCWLKNNNYEPFWG